MSENREDLKVTGTGTPAVRLRHPRREPLCGEDLITFRLRKGGPARPGYVVAPPGGESTAEIFGDKVTVRSVHAVPLCRAHHRFVTEKGHLPGRSREETRGFFLLVSHAVIILYIQRLEALLAPLPALHLPPEEKALLDLLNEAEVSYAA